MVSTHKSVHVSMTEVMSTQKSVLHFHMSSNDTGCCLKLAMPNRQNVDAIGTCSVICLPRMPSWPCNVRPKATEDGLTAQKCGPIGTDRAIRCNPMSVFFSQHQDFLFLCQIAALVANIDCLSTDLFLLVREGIIFVECLLCADQ